MGETELAIQYIKGVGPARAALFLSLGVTSPQELLRYYPRDWQDRRTGSLLSMFRQNETSVVLGRVIAVRSVPARRVSILKAFFKAQDGGEFEAVWFKHVAGMRYDPFSSLKKELREGRLFWLVGRPGDNGAFRAEECYADDDAMAHLAHIGRIVPVYPLTAGLTAKFMRETVRRALDDNSRREPDPLPSFLVRKRGLLTLSQSLKGIHFPDTMQEKQAAKKRLAYEEFLFLTTAWSIKRLQTKADEKNRRYEIKKNLLTPFRQKLGFEFTADQARVINEIFRDMLSTRPMTRLLQGDVGSGKTVVALSALLLAVENGFQGAFMAPTEILAAQHFMTFQKFLDGLSVRFKLITSKTTAKEKAKIAQAAADGELDIVIGTHSLIEDKIKFKNLALAVIDEQHRFGVRQRAALRQKADHTDLLIMTATPIPRTLAMALYGDLDVSTITTLPPGRKPIKTEIADEHSAFAAARAEAAKGRQVYIVHPLIEESEKQELKSVKQEFERLSKDVFPDLRLDILHGQMSAKDKSAVMERFASGKTDILVATPVIEVGIDVKNATLMIVRNAERFGLASLHQLRGRIGRGEHESRCLLVTESDSRAALERLDTMCATSDGFKIGEKDMQMRGPGEVLGTMQHGDLEFRIADILDDRDMLTWALEDKDAILARDPLLNSPANMVFRRKLAELYSRKWHLIDLA